MPPGTFASWLIFFVAAAAPWFCGARSHLPNLLWIFGGLQMLALATLVIEKWIHKRALRTPGVLTKLCLVLSLPLAWWAVSAEPMFATSFAESHWAFLQREFPAAMLTWTRAERLWFVAGSLCALLAAAELGRDQTFRRRLCLVIGVSGLVMSLGALAQRFLGVSSPSWLLIGGSTERYNFVFFHHSAAAACFNLAWPLVAFHGLKQGAGLFRAVVWAVLGAVACVCFPLWKSESAWVIAIALVLGALAWWSLMRFAHAEPKLIFCGVGGALVAALALQLVWIERTRARYPDNWLGEAATRESAPERDTHFAEMASRRGDRMVPSDTPPRPAAWIAGMRMAMAYPIIGYGPGAWSREAVVFSNEPTVSTFYQHRQFAHHDLLQTAAEWGIVPALLWVALWVGAFYRAIRRDPTDLREMGLVLALIALALHSMLHFPLQLPLFQLWAALLLGLAWSRRPRREREDENDEEKNRSTRHRRVSLA